MEDGAVDRLIADMAEQGFVYVGMARLPNGGIGGHFVQERAMETKAYRWLQGSYPPFIPSVDGVSRNEGA